MLISGDTMSFLMHVMSFSCYWTDSTFGQWEKELTHFLALFNITPLKVSRYLHHAFSEQHMKAVSSVP